MLPDRPDRYEVIVQMNIYNMTSHYAQAYKPIKSYNGTMEMMTSQ